jgi:hypothetical protein
LLCLALAGGSPLAESEETKAAEIALVSGVTFTVSPNRVYVGEEVTFNATATTSVPGGTLYFSIYVDSWLDGSGTNNTESPVLYHNTTDSPASVSIPYTYDAAGPLGTEDTYYVVTLRVSDGSDTKVRTLQVYVLENIAPSWIIYLPTMRQYTESNEEFDGRTLTLNSTVLRVKVEDRDDDALEVLWNFGDGNESLNVTGPAADGVYVNQTHTWMIEVPPGTGDYDVTIFVWANASDGNGHTISSMMRLILSIPENDGPEISLTAKSQAAPMEVVTFVGSATDDEGDPLTWTFRFGDGNITVVHTNKTQPGERVWVNVTHAYAEIGTYITRLNVSDALVPYQVYPHNVSVSFEITIRLNVPPFVGAINVLPDNPEINLTTGVAIVTLSVQVRDESGDPLTVEWSFGDGSDIALNSTAGGTGIFRLKQTHNYTEPGSFSVTVRVSDGVNPQVVVNRLVNITSKNKAPSLIELRFEYDSRPLKPNDTFRMVVVIEDSEMDTVEVHVDFGDGSPMVFLNLSDYVDLNVTFVLNHSYSRIGTFYITLWFTDNQIGELDHVTTSERSVTVEYPAEVIVHEWDWWDYTSLALFCMIPVAGVVLIFSARRKQKLLERKGITYEEWQLRKEELASELKKSRKES